MDKFERKDTSENPYIEELTYTQLAMKYVSSNAEPKQKEFMSTVVKEGDEGFKITEQMDLIVTHNFEKNTTHFLTSLN